jgi:phi13 family phage major tail protein
MAAFGATFLAVAKVATEGTNSITYDTGAQVEHLRRCAVTYNWDEAKLYGDNMLAEYLKTLTDADIEIETTELTPAVAVTMGLEAEKAAATSGVPAVYTLKTESGDPLGVGFVQCFIVNGTKIFRGVWFHKVTFSPSNEEANTKEETLNWGTPTISGKAWPIMLDASGEAQVRDFSDFDTEAKAIAWVKTKAGISTSP